MMGFGSSNGNGGFASSSNLSPLAPPFTVDRPTSRSALNCHATPYGTPYTTPSHTNWGNSLVPDYQTTLVSETASPAYFPNCTMYSVSSPAEPQIDHMVYSSSSSPVSDSVLFSQFPSSLMKNNFGDGNYCALPSSWDKASVMALSELGYKSSSTLNSIGVTQDNYTQSLYGLQYPSQWDHSWDVHLDVESGGKTSFLDTIAPEAPNCINASTYSSYFKEGSELPKVLGKSSGELWVPQINNVTNIQNPVRSLGTDTVVVKPLSEFNANETCVSKISDIPTRNSGMSYTTTSDVSIMDSWGHLVPPTATNGTIHKQHCLNDTPSAPTSFNGVTIGNPSAVTSFTFSGSVPPQNTVMLSDNDLSAKTDDVVYERLYNVRDPWICQRSKPGPEIKKYMTISAGSIDPQQCDSNVMLFPAKYGEPSGINSVSSGPLDVVKQKEVADVHDNIHNLESFSLLIDESDQYNPSEDSPCWKGSSSYFSQFQVSEAIPSQHHLKSLNSYDGLNHNKPRTFSLTGNIPTKVFSTDSHEKTTQSTSKCLGEDDALLSSTESCNIGNHLYDMRKSNVSHTTNKLDATERNPTNAFSFHNDNHISVEEKGGKMESFIVKKPESPNPIRLCLGTMYCGSDKEKASARMMNTDVNLYDAPEECHSFVPSNAAKQFLSYLSSDADMSSKQNQENWDGYATESKTTLLKTITNLSDSLLFYYLHDEAPAGNEDHKILELVLCKLTLCLKFAQEKSRTKESLIHKQGPSNVNNQVHAFHYAMADKPQVTDANNHHEDGAMLGFNFEGLHKPVREDGNHGIEEAGSMTKAIKDILDSNFHEDTDSYPLATMYKNLWLEAEAVLCSTNYKARYSRMKIEMEKSGSHEEKEKSLKCKASPTHMEVSQKSSSVGKSVHAADVMERYNILKCRVETSSKGIGGELDSSKTSSAQRTVNKLSTQVNGFTTHETFIKDVNTGCQAHDGQATNVSRNPGTTLTKTYPTDMAEDPVMRRLQVLKSRGDYPEYKEPEQQPSEFTMDSVDRRDHSLVCGGELLDGRFNPAFKTGITKETVALLQDGFEGVDCASGSEPNCQDFAHNSKMVDPGVQFSGRLYDNTSSDWEHVLKDEFTWTGGGIINP